MNHIYRTLWSVATQSWQAVPETAKTAGKKSKSSAGGVIASVALSFSLTGGANAQAPPAINQLPTGGTVARGTATINQTATAQAAAMTVNQTSQRAVVNWNTFNIGSNASVNFVQPNAQAITLNRVSDANPSQIFGRMTSNGQVVLTNANGIYFAPSSSVDVGAITATTHSITDDNFMSGKYVFERNGATGKIINEGNITAALAGYVALLAPEVQNAGVVVARAGTVAMAAGETITLNIDGAGSLAGITTTPSAIATLIENKQAVQAPDGQIILSAVALNKLQAGVIKNSGSLEANSLVSKGGKIYLEGDDITLSSTSKIEAKGATGGGTVLVGGDWQGSGDMRQATKVTMEAGATIDANATDKGDGGKVVLWSDVHNADSVTQVNGSIKAEAGPNGGDGGQVETSGHTLNVNTIDVTTHSSQGAAGSWLLDPYDFTVAASGGDMTGAALSTFLAGGNITLKTTSVAAGTPNTTSTAIDKYGATSGTTGHIYINDNISWGVNKLTLDASANASGSVYVNARINSYGTSTLDIKHGASGFLLMGLNNAPASSGGGFYGSINFTTTQGGTTGRTGTGILTINNNAYKLISTVGASTDAAGTTSLQGAGNTAYVAMATDIDASATSTWNLVSGTDYAGFKPLTSTGSTIFNGLGHVIQGLYINANATVTNVGLYGTTPYTGIFNLGIDSTSSINSQAVNSGTGTVNTGANPAAKTFTAFTGAIAGQTSINSAFSMSNSYSMASVNAVSGAVGGVVGDFLGGKLKNLGSFGSIYVKVSDTTGTVVAGGMLGEASQSYTSTIDNSLSSANVSITHLNSNGSGASQSLYAGGFVGYTAVRTIGQSQTAYTGNTATGSVTVTGASALDITTTPSQPFGAVAGGFAGYADGEGNSGSPQFLFKQNSASGDISINKGIAGSFIGLVNTAYLSSSNIYINESYATGNASISDANANNMVGGFLGTVRIDNGTVEIINTYSTGNATGNLGKAGSFIGGVIGSNYRVVTIRYNYALGIASGATTNLSAFSVTAGPGMAPSTITTPNYYGSTGASGADNNLSNLNSTATTNTTLWGKDSSINGGHPFLISNSPTSFAPSLSVKTSGTWGGLTATVVNPVLYGTGITGDTVNVYDGNTSLGSVTVSSGFWAYKAASNIAFGQHNYKVNQTSSVSATYNSKYTLVSPYYLLPLLYVFVNTGQSMTYGSTPSISYSLFTDDAGMTPATGITYANTALFSGVDSHSNASTTPYAVSYLSGLNISGYSLLAGTARDFTVNKAHLTVTAANASKTYGSANPTFTATVSGFVNGESLATSGVTGTGSGSTLATASTNAGTAVISAGAGTLSASNYDFTNLVDGTLTINKAHLTVTANDTSKAYGSANPSFTTTVSGFVNGESLATSGVTGAGAGSSLATTSTNVGSAVITAGAGTLSATNYDFTNLVDGTLTINKAHLTVTASNASKTYGSANPALTATVSGFVNGESLATSGVTGSGTATTTATNSTGAGIEVITAGAGTLTATNYDFTNLVNGALTINKAHLTVTANDTSKTYGSANPTFTGTVSGFVNGESLATSGVTGAGSGTTTATTTTGIGTAVITATTGTLSAANYDFTNLVNGTLTINKANLSKVTATKPYDGLNSVSAAQMTAIEGVNGETFTATVGTAAIGSKNVFASGNTLTDLRGLTLNSTNGGLANNYNLNTGLPAAGSNNQVSISAIDLQVTGVSAANKVYDATRSASLTGAATVAGISGDDVSATGTGMGLFASKDVATAKPVTVTGFTLTGTDAGNYNVVQPVGVTADITQAALTISGITAQNKVYDGGTTATVSTANVAKGGLFAGDVVDIAATGSFATKTVANAKHVTLTSSYSGADVGNYLITNQTSANADITAKALGLSIPGASRVYDGSTVISPSGPVTLSGIVGVDQVSLGVGNVTGYVDKNVGTNKTVTYSGLTLGGSDAGNYSLPLNPTSDASITPAALSISGITAANKTYDAGISATVSTSNVVKTGLIGNDVVNVAATGSFADKNVGTSKTVTLSSSYSGTDAGNYSITDQAMTTAEISKADLTVTGITAANKVYDATRTATLNGTATVSALANDVVSLAGTGTGQFADKNVGVAKSVAVSGYTLTGTDADNYNVVQPTGLTADISKADLSVTGITAVNKVYDATRTASLNGTATVNALANDVVNLAGSGTGQFTDKNVGVAKSVAVSGYTLTGTDADNYNVVQPTGLTADINKAPLTVTAANAVKNLGDANPALTVALTGFVGGETLATSGVTGTGLATTTATVSTDAGTAAIAASAGTLAASNYAFTNLVDGTLTIRPISALNNNEVSTLIGAQLANLSGAQVGSFSASQLQVFSPQQLSALSPSQLAGMTTLQLLSLSPVQMAAISPAKVALMTAAELGAFTDAQLQALSPTQLAAIAPANFAAFTPAQIMAMSIAQVQKLSPEQLATFTPAQIASLNAAELAYFDARQLAAIGIFPKVETPVTVTAAVTLPIEAKSISTPTPQTTASNTAVPEVADASDVNADKKDKRSTFEAAIPVMTEVATANTPAGATPEPLQAATPVQSAALSPRAVQALLFPPNAESSARTGVLAITILNSAQAKPTTAGIAFEQDADTVSLRLTSAPTAVPPMSDKVVFSDKLVTFMVATSSGVMVEFEGSVVNNRMIILAPSAMAKRVARTEMSLVLAAAVTSLGKENRVILTKLDGVVLDLR